MFSNQRTVFRDWQKVSLVSTIKCQELVLSSPSRPVPHVIFTFAGMSSSVSSLNLTWETCL